MTSSRFCEKLHLDWTTFTCPPYKSVLVLVGALAFHLLDTAKQDVKCGFGIDKVGLAPLLLSPDVGF